MTDIHTRKLIRVETDAVAGSSIRISEDQLEEVCKLLDANEVPYWVAHQTTSFDGGPFWTWIHLRNRADPKRAQELLDQVA